jgi:hypothetical protein
MDDSESVEDKDEILSAAGAFVAIKNLLELDPSENPEVAKLFNSDEVDEKFIVLALHRVMRGWRNARKN